MKLQPGDIFATKGRGITGQAVQRAEIDGRINRIKFTGTDI